MHTVQIGEMKAHLSKILERIRTEGEEFVLEFGRGHEKVAVLPEFDTSAYKHLIRRSRAGQIGTTAARCSLSSGLAPPAGRKDPFVLGPGC